MKLINKNSILIVIAVACTTSGFAQNPFIKLRQDLFYYKGQKSIRIRNHEPKGAFYLLDAQSNDTVYKGELSLEIKSERSSKMVTKANFTAFEKEGKFRLYVPAVKTPTDPFEITARSNDIRLNQVGFYPDGDKIAVVADPKGMQFFITTPDYKDTVFGGPLQKQQYFKPAEEVVRLINFSRFKTPGKYKLVIPEMGTSAVFEIKEKVYHEASRAAIRAYYYNRASMKLDEKYAGKWNRPMGHPDDSVVIHPAAASNKRPAGTVISSPRGWYDAGDYGKYIVNSGISTYTLLSAMEQYPEYYKSLNLNIPESGNNVPDLLDEILWNLRWMLTMQDPNDGGVYHKLTTANFVGEVMPHETNKVRYVLPKGTAASLDFAGTMAAAYRVIKPYEKELPGLADSCLKAAKAAFSWAGANNNVPYEQNKMNEEFEPKVVTGAYGDSKFDDEQFWAAAELFLATESDEYYGFLQLGASFSIPSWSNVRTLGLISLANNENSKQESAKAKLIAMAREQRDNMKTSAYRIVMGAKSYDFVWGSNSVAANQGMILLNAYKLTNDESYYEAALSNLDYLFGRNATGYCFVTGFGERSPMDIHHRPSRSDGIVEPVPGFVCGGPQPGQQDHCGYEKTKPANCYADKWCSYSTNEITINWNAPLVYMLGAIEYKNSK